MVGDLHLNVIGVGPLEGVDKGSRPNSALHWVPLNLPAAITGLLLIQISFLALRAEVGYQHILGRQRNWITCTKATYFNLRQLQDVACCSLAATR